MRGVSGCRVGHLLPIAGAALTPPDLDTLKDGLSSPFWEWFQAHKEAEWGRGGARFHEAVMKAASKDEANGHAYLQMVIFAQAEIERLFMAPTEAYNKARQSRAVEMKLASPSRRGPGM